MSELRSGDILSYSAGSTQTGPDGYRFARRADGGGRGVDLLGAVRARWPDLEMLGRTPLMFVNGYPAYVGDFKAGVQVDTYVSPRTADRALALAAREELTAVLLAQPLFAAEILLAERVRPAPPLPTSMALWTGGYATPSSLEQTMVDAARERGCTLKVIQFYGAAEVDAGCLIGRERDARGEVIYFKRGDDVRADVRDDVLYLQRRDSSGDWCEPFDTGDHARHSADGLVVVADPARVAPEVWTELNGWTSAQWRRRTGYVEYTTQGLFFQLREGCEVTEANEVGFHEFCRRTSMSWLSKPRWGRVTATVE